jgi:hypothetical protein
MSRSIPHPRRRKRCLNEAAVAALHSVVAQSSLVRAATMLRTTPGLILDVFSGAGLLLATAERIERALLGQPSAGPEAEA